MNTQLGKQNIVFILHKYIAKEFNNHLNCYNAIIVILQDGFYFLFVIKSMRKYRNSAKEQSRGFFMILFLKFDVF